MITNITDERIAELRRQVAVMESLIAQGRDPRGSYRALLETSKRDLAQFETRRRSIATPGRKPLSDGRQGPAPGLNRPPEDRP